MLPLMRHSAVCGFEVCSGVGVGVWVEVDPLVGSGSESAGFVVSPLQVDGDQRPRLFFSAFFSAVLYSDCFW